MSFVVGDVLVEIDLWLVILVVLIIIALAVFIINRAVKAHQLKIAAGREELIGRKAAVRTALTPRGTVFIDGEIWTAVLDEGQADTGEEVYISRVEGLVLYVTREISKEEEE